MAATYEQRTVRDDELQQLLEEVRAGAQIVLAIPSAMSAPFEYVEQRVVEYVVIFKYEPQ